MEPTEQALQAIQSDRPPARLGAFEILKPIGSGGMGVVYRAWDENLNRTVAVKVISPKHAGDAGQMERLRREAQSTAQLSHPHIVAIFAFGVEQGFPYIATEYLDGMDLQRLVNESGSLPPHRAVRYIREAAEALGYAAAKNIVHRDIKPSNIFLTSDDRIVVMDFGLAKQIGVDASLTLTGNVLGTPTYISPEQITSTKSVDFRTDMYSLGLTLYTLLSGLKPYDGATAAAMFAKHVMEPLALPPEWEKLARGELSRLIRRLVEKDPAKRYATWGEAIDAMRKVEFLLSGSAPAGPGMPSWLTPARMGMAAAGACAVGILWFMWGLLGNSPTVIAPMPAAQVVGAGMATPRPAAPAISAGVASAPPVAPPVASAPKPAGDPPSPWGDAAPPAPPPPPPLPPSPTPEPPPLRPEKRLQTGLSAAVKAGHWDKGLELITEAEASPEMAALVPDFMLYDVHHVLALMKDIDTRHAANVPKSPEALRERRGIVLDLLKKDGDTLPLAEAYAAVFYLFFLDINDPVWVEWHNKVRDRAGDGEVGKLFERLLVDIPKFIGGTATNFPQPDPLPEEMARSRRQFGIPIPAPPSQGEMGGGPPGGPGGPGGGPGGGRPAPPLPSGGPSIFGPGSR